MPRFAGSSLAACALAGSIVLAGSLLAGCGGAQASSDDSANDAIVVAAAMSFLAADDGSDASDLVELIAADGDRRWAPWLIDLLRLSGNSLLDVRIGEVLETMTGLPSRARVLDLVAYGGWAQTLGLDGGAGYREFKAGTYARIDDRFGDLLRSVVDQGELAAIQFGGVPLGGIPELNSPAKLAAAEATWMTGDEAVLGVEVGGETVAYPLRILSHHELVNDTVGGRDIAVVYCTLCKSALVFDSTSTGQVLHFQTSGLLINSNKIMYDLETGSLWRHLQGRSIAGPMAGSVLETLPVVLVEWSSWVDTHPETTVIDLPEPIFFEEVERPPIAYDYRPGAAYRSYYDNPDLWFPVVDTPDTFDLKTEVVGIENNGQSLAIERAAITTTIEVEVGGSRFVVTPTGPGVRVTDNTGGEVVAEQSFWFAWHAEHPETGIWEAGG